MSVYRQMGNLLIPTNPANVEYLPKLPTGNYMVCYNPDLGGFYFEESSEFSYPSKVYGDAQQTADRIFSTYMSRLQGNNVSTGVLLAGEKGSGKTLISKLICKQALSQELPILIVGSGYSGPVFNKFIQDINQPAVVFFDEFEKVYKSNIYDTDGDLVNNGGSQDALLSLFDGTQSTDKLFLLTCNDKSGINRNMVNRPGRIFYFLEFAGLSSQFIREYCNENLINKANLESVCLAASLFLRFNFDMLAALVEEMNRYNESAAEVMKYVNAHPSDYGDSTNYTIELTVKGKLIKPELLYQKTVDINPITSRATTVHYYPTKRSEDMTYEVFNVEDLVTVDIDSKSFKYVNAAGNQLALTYVPPRSFDINQITGMAANAYIRSVS